MNNSISPISVKPKYYIGLMSGTSADGIDLALVSFDKNRKLKHHASYYLAYKDETALKIKSLYNPDNNEIDRAFALDIELAKLFFKAINAFLAQEQISNSEIIAIGSHGQTIRHRPQITDPFTLQIGCCQTLATLTNIRVVGQFRRRDMALGGQGAPLVPAFHETIFRETAQKTNNLNSGADVFVVNIGGISNLTFLPETNQSNIVGYDTGPGNALMDDWFQLHNPNSDNKYDKNGDWASTGKINQALLNQLLLDNYFKLPPPKSTGREYFHLSWLENQLNQVNQVNSQDVQATLTAFTAITIVNAINQHISVKEKLVKVYLCGGGVHNKSLKNLINQQLKIGSANYELLLTNQKDIDSDQVEAIAFAWLAFAYDKKFLSSMSTVTGASKNCTLGNEYLP
jgi:anhydro-N-acetylmuramic acid kinase